MKFNYIFVKNLKIKFDEFEITNILENLVKINLNFLSRKLIENSESTMYLTKEQRKG